MMQNRKSKSLQGESSLNEKRWNALVDRERNTDEEFFYSVKTTGVYCRPSCPSRLPKRENVRFHPKAADAENAGFRPCKRCKPNTQRAEKQQSEIVSKACRVIAESEEPPNLKELSTSAGLSPSHFHRLFKSQTGLTPKVYADACRARRVREQLNGSNSVTAAFYQAGFNSSGRFYAATSSMLGMRPKDFRARGRGVTIRFAVAECTLGTILIAESDVGVCDIMLGTEPDKLVRELEDQFQQAELVGNDIQFERRAATVIASVEDPSIGLDLPLDIRGTAFQQRVWQKLLQIPRGETRSYSEIAKAIGQPQATRAVASACAANRIAVIIPCHRVIRTDGSISGYRWGVDVKKKLILIETRAAPHP